uniref:Uncharacterized protein n=1 Tax=Arundo donax TaxID=35708 RepID=A0A0A8Z379_ARUDO
MTRMTSSRRSSFLG